MKSYYFILAAGMALVGTSLFAQEKTDSFRVYGNCGMCKKRIEKAAITEGVTTAIWDVDTKMMLLTYDTAKTSLDAVQQRIAAVGHDTGKYRADDKVYAKLPGCCLYERKKNGEEKNFQ